MGSRSPVIGQTVTAPFGGSRRLLSRSSAVIWLVALSLAIASCTTGSDTSGETAIAEPPPFTTEVKGEPSNKGGADSATGFSLRPTSLMSIGVDADGGTWARDLPGQAALYVVAGRQTSIQNPRLVVGTIDAAPLPPEGLWEPMGEPLVAELEGAELVSATIEFPVDLAQVPQGTDAADFFGIAWFDETAGEWRVADSVIDHAASVVRVETSHLSLWNPFTWGREPQDLEAMQVTLSGSVNCDTTPGGGWMTTQQPSRLEMTPGYVTAFTWKWEEPDWTYRGAFADNPTGRYSLSVTIPEGARSTRVPYRLWCGEPIDDPDDQGSITVHRSDTTRNICDPDAVPCGRSYEIGECLVAWFFAGAPVETDLAWFVLDGNLEHYPEIALEAADIVTGTVGVLLKCGRLLFEAGSTTGDRSDFPDEIPDVGPTETIRLSKGSAYGPGKHWYSVALSGFAPGSQVALTCHDSVDSSFWFQAFTINSSGGASDSTLCYSGDGPDHWVTGGGVESNHVSW